MYHISWSHISSPTPPMVKRHNICKYSWIVLTTHLVFKHTWSWQIFHKCDVHIIYYWLYDCLSKLFQKLYILHSFDPWISCLSSHIKPESLFVKKGTTIRIPQLASAILTKNVNANYCSGLSMNKPGVWIMVLMFRPFSLQSPTHGMDGITSLHQETLFWKTVLIRLSNSSTSVSAYLYK